MFKFSKVLTRGINNDWLTKTKVKDLEGKRTRYETNAERSITARKTKQVLIPRTGTTIVNVSTHVTKYFKTAVLIL